MLALLFLIPFWRQRKLSILLVGTNFVFFSFIAAVAVTSAPFFKRAILQTNNIQGKNLHLWMTLCGLGSPPPPQSLGSDWAGRMIWELGQTLLPVSKFHKAHGGNFVVSFLVEVVDFITMWFYFHCTRCCCPSPPIPSDTLCTPVPGHRALILPNCSVFAVLWACRDSKQTIPSPTCSVPCPGSTCCSNLSVSLCAMTGTFLRVGSLNPWFVLTPREMFSDLGI